MLSIFGRRSSRSRHDLSPPSLVVLFGLVLHTSLAAAQSSQTASCYYPDGTLSTTDTPCAKGASACCGASAFCMDNGLCFSGGLLSRGSCTDKTWGSAACAGYCKTVSPSSSVDIIPCSSSTFVCGLDSSTCSTTSSTFALPNDLSVVLRPAQVAQLLGSAVTQAAPSNTTTTTTTSTSGMVSLGALIGVAAGMGVPMIIAIVIAIVLWRREAKRSPKLMYPLPDNSHSEFSFRPPPTLVGSSGFRRQSMTSNVSEATSLRTVNSPAGPLSPNMPGQGFPGYSSTYNVGGLRSPTFPPDLRSPTFANTSSSPKPPMQQTAELDSRQLSRQELLAATSNNHSAVSLQSSKVARGQVRQVSVRASRENI